MVVENEKKIPTILFLKLVCNIRLQNTRNYTFLVFNNNTITIILKSTSCKTNCKLGLTLFGF